MTDASVEINEALGRTSSSLLDRIKNQDQDAWRRLVHLYSPLVYSWCRRAGLQEADAADVGQDVFRKVAESIASFHHDQPGDSFRGWLRTITRTRVVDHQRRQGRTVPALGGSDAQALLAEFPDRPEDSVATDEEDRHLLHRRAVDLVLENCREETRQAFWRVVVAGQPAAEVAQALGMTVNAVYVAKSHILRKIREEFAQIVDL